MIYRIYVRRFKKVKIKAISVKNKTARVRFGEALKHESIWSYWQYVYFSDEAHFDPGEVPREYILRLEGTRYEVENM